MRTLLLSLFTLAILSGHAQHATPVTPPAKAMAQLENIKKQTQATVVIGRRASTLPAEVRPMLNTILVQSAKDFLAITAQKPTREAYLQSLDAGLVRLMPLVPQVEDRQQVAEYYQDLLDIVGLDSSEGRLTAFVEGNTAGK